MLPCSEVHWRILPAISREIAFCLAKERMPKVKIAAALGTTPAAISQYLKGKRGKTRIGRETREACSLLAKRIAAGKLRGAKLDAEVAKVVALAKGSGLGKKDPCVICASYAEGL
jgi:predicted transcriptional regulator